MTNCEISKSTMKKLSDSLKHKMNTKPFSKITVTEIIKDCHITRSTFYYHFEDKNGLFRWTVNEGVLDMVRQIDFVTNAEGSIRYVLDYVDDNHQLLKCAYDSLGHDEMKRFFYTDMKTVVATNINHLEKSSRFVMSRAVKDYLCEFFIEGAAGMIFNYVDNTNHMKREDIIQSAEQISLHLRLFA